MRTSRIWTRCRNQVDCVSWTSQADVAMEVFGLFCQSRSFGNVDLITRLDMLVRQSQLSVNHRTCYIISSNRQGLDTIQCVYVFLETYEEETVEREEQKKNCIRV